MNKLGLPMDDLDKIKEKLTELKNEHRDMDDIILQLTTSLHCDQIKLQRLKKRKLLLKDQIAQIEDGMLPDIIA